MHKCLAMLACGVVALGGMHLHHHGCPGARLLAALGVDVCATAEPAEDKKDDKAGLSGTWTMKGGMMKLAFSDKDVMKLYPHGETEGPIIVCNYTVQKDGAVKAKVTELEGKVPEKVKELVPVGVEFTFTWKVKEGTAKLDDVKGEKADVFKAHMEGEYEKK